MRRSERSARRRRAWEGLLIGALVVTGLVLVGIGFAPLIPVSGSSPTVVAAPGPTQSEEASPVPSVTPLPTATPTPTEAPEPPPWEFTGGHISAPTIGLEANIAEYTFEQKEATDGDVHPPTDMDAYYYSGYYKHFGVKSILSPEGDFRTFVYGHACAWDPCVFNGMKSNAEQRGLLPGDIVTVTTGAGEVTTLRVREQFNVLKVNFSTDPRVFVEGESFAGTWIFVACEFDGPRDLGGGTINNTVVVFDVVQPEPAASASQSRPADRY